MMLASANPFTSGGGATIYLVGMIRMLITAFSESVGAGLFVLFCPFGHVIYACKRWREVKFGFLANIVGAGILCSGFFSDPDTQARFAQLTNRFTGGYTASAPANLDAQIQEQRQRLETLEATFSQNGAGLAKQYQDLDTQRKALKPGDAAAIAKFNAAAAIYQARNSQRKQMQQDIDAGQKQLDTLLDTRSRTSAVPKVVMYTTSHCPACQAAKQYLAQKGVSYQEIDVETSREGAKAFQQLGGHGVPLILVGNKRLEGFSRQTLDAAL
ncbi:MAG TPA: glutaredoxin family protein [Chthoniobacter sp.]|jgi:glutaredoxin